MKSNISLAEDFATSELIYGDWRASLTWFTEMMNVKASDIQRVAQSYLINSNRILGMIENNNANQKKAGKKKA